MTSLTSGLVQEVAEGVFFYTIQIVNIVFIKTKNSIVLIDTGMTGSGRQIIELMEGIFGSVTHPGTIILIHGHFDHAGSVEQLLKRWHIPVYAYPLEIPYLTGKKSYPEPDGTVEGGLIAKLSPLFPNESIDLGDSVRPLPNDGSLPLLPGRRWIHTPGHTEGHISLFREKDRTLIAGDAFITVRQDSLYKVLLQKQEIYGPPRYFTTDWEQAKASVAKLAGMDPYIAVTGHGLPLEGDELEQGLAKLVKQFDTMARPDYGKFV